VDALLIVNPRSGDGGADALLAAARELGLRTHLLANGESPGEVARAAEAEALAMAGGDGSLGAVAAVAIERDLPFACVPFGTRNHFARDVGLDRDDPIAALDALTGGMERRIDVGRVNDRLFLNNVSLGVYARLVHRREHHRRRSEAFARLRALAAVAAHRHPVRLTVDGTPLHAHAVLVSNNAYELSVFSLGERLSLDEGLLHLYAPTGLLRSDWEEQSAERFTVGASTARVRAAVDGEPALFETPIELRVEPRALRVLVPRGPLA
jgi:diacylglycerol kinase family enzyme